MRCDVVTCGSNQFGVSDDEGNLLGEMKLDWVANSKADIVTTEGNSYKITTTGFWGMAKVVLKNGVPYAEIKPTFSHGIIITFENGQVFHFKKKSMWNLSDYKLVNDATNEEIAMASSRFRMNGLKFDYEVEILQPLYDKDANILLPFLLLYCIKLLRMRGAAA
jgi:hypothetical protein